MRRPMDTKMMSQWRANWLGRIVAQARLRKWQCPLVWTTSSSFDGVHDDKLQDLVTLAPSEWEAVVRELTRIAMLMHTNGDMRGLVQSLRRCEKFLHSPRRRSMCPLLSEYREALKHVVDVTCIMVACVLEKKNLDQEPGAETVADTDTWGPSLKAAMLAMQAQVRVACFLGLPSGAETAHSGTLLLPHALVLASRAKDAAPEEGEWKALYADLLPHDHPRKLTLLRNAVRARRTPFTLTCLSRFLYKLGENEAFDLCADALLEWPLSVHTNVSYVLMFLSCAAPCKLSGCLAEQCLLRLQRLVPQSMFALGLALELRLHTESGAKHVRPQPYGELDHATVDKAQKLYAWTRPGRPRLARSTSTAANLREAQDPDRH
ncbi:uncharacterized protein LOC113211200 isoform X2 [Frankliniella occidentalis]|uniref:Uncharacterized protein LOC113211200 isoform X2 n=1 Tax=Frankliniella occidentalis TaxID=133901 RepID=A0A9C6X328_FRAOC|nr:uncharacterized protein LOC113211200 isoform X2 [Frankliniella occidentalis]